jgi:hypothetical protein
MLRYFFDELVAEAIGEQLKLCGIDVLTAKDATLVRHRGCARPRQA